ncbi:hypothetical protein [Nocardia sp. NPDC049149]|uniref:hypothetical protein n=1 Tax=Nocardia sp. NPDC049149 TaxID=3364315 RepID=UPI00371827D3
MARTWDEAELIAEGFERVHIESEIYDGPRAGLADIGGQPHYFDTTPDCTWGGDVDEYLVWRASEQAVAWEFERWAIYVTYAQRLEAGEVGSGSHPGYGGIDARYDELTRLLAPHRERPDTARKLVAELRFDQREGYRIDGTDLWFRWTAQ